MAEALGDLLGAIHDLEKASLEEKSESPTGALQAQLPGSLLRIQTEYLEKLRPSAKQLAGSSNRSYLYLQPLDKDSRALPLLAFEYDLETRFSLALRVMLFRIDREHHVIDTVGFRFESGGSGNRHSYYHAQPIRKLIPGVELPKRMGTWKVRSPWMPETQPAIPLDANSPLSLLVCMLISLYGSPFMTELRSQVSRNTWDLVGRELQNMRLEI